MNEAALLKRRLAKWQRRACFGQLIGWGAFAESFQRQADAAKARLGFQEEAAPVGMRHTHAETAALDAFEQLIDSREVLELTK